MVVSGTHASGKSTLIADFALRHPEYTVLPDPFELMDEANDAPGAASFAAQLRIAADRLTQDASENLIAERGPLDFLAYLLALAELSETELDEGYLDRAMELTREAMQTVDLLVVLPLNAADTIHVGVDEHLELRTAMNEVLLELVEDAEVVGERVHVLEVTGDVGARLDALEDYGQPDQSRK